LSSLGQFGNLVLLSGGKTGRPIGKKIQKVPKRTGPITKAENVGDCVVWPRKMGGGGEKKEGKMFALQVSQFQGTNYQSSAEEPGFSRVGQREGKESSGTGQGHRTDLHI